MAKNDKSDKRNLKRKTTKTDDFAGLKMHLSEWIRKDFHSTRREALIKKWEKIDLNYSGEYGKKDFPWRGAANVNLLITEFFTDGIAVRIQNFLMGNDFRADLTTVDGKEAFQRLEVVEKFLNAVMETIVLIKKLIYPICQATAKKGCITRVDWDIEEKFQEEQYSSDEFEAELKEMAQLLQSGQITEEDLLSQELPEPKLVKKRTEKAKVSIVPREDFAWPDDATSLETACRKTQRMWLTLDFMKDHDFKELDNIETWLVEEKLKEANITASQRSAIEKRQVNFGREKLEVFEVTTDYTIDGKKDLYTIYYHRESDLLLKTVVFRDVWGDRLSQFQRFVVKEDGTFEGRSVGDITFQSQSMGNNIQNALLNEIALKIQGVIFYEENAFEYDEKGSVNIQNYPGASNRVKDVTKIVFREFPGQPLLGWDAIDKLIGLLEKTIGLSAPQLGQPTTTKKTLGEIQAVRSEGNLGHEAKFISAGEAFSDMIKTVLTLYQKHMPTDMFKDLVEKGDLVFPEGLEKRDIAGNFSPAVEGAKGLQTQFEKVQTATALTEFSNPEEVVQLVDTREVMTNLIESAGEDPEKFLISKEEQLKKQAAIQAEAMKQLLQEQIEEQQEAEGVEPVDNGGVSPEISGLLQQFGG